MARQGISPEGYPNFFTFYLILSSHLDTHYPLRPFPTVPVLGCASWSPGVRSLAGSGGDAQVRVVGPSSVWLGRGGVLWERVFLPWAVLGWGEGVQTLLSASFQSSALSLVTGGPGGAFPSIGLSFPPEGKSNGAVTPKTRTGDLPSWSLSAQQC